MRFLPYYVTPESRSKVIKQRRKSSRLQAQKERAPVTMSAFNPQSACPFFRPERGLPREIRELIFQLALTSYEDKSRPRNIEVVKKNDVAFTDNTDYARYRPGHFCIRRTDTALLRTCKAIYQETHLLPIAVNQHTLWYSHVPAVRTLPATTASDYFNAMTDEQLAAVQHVQIFGQSAFLGSQDPGQYINEGIFAELGVMRGGPSRNQSRRISGDVLKRARNWGPQTISITIRHMDWNHYFIDLSHMLRNRHWENVLGELKVLRIELEVPGDQRNLLTPVIKSLTDFSFDIGNGEELVAEQEVQESTWIGPWRDTCGLWPEPMWSDKEFFVATITWKVRSK